ncbi:MAG: glycerol-3-phosphate 1-O-acyltransferase PlsY [Candidatus Gastranaerophilales bacterium]|nr:glycerol-3-phosphate 1-O-acyltransferase PlsY [Candidatus Gastranaerophilales bacterium]
MIMVVVKMLTIFVIAYLIGSIPTGYLIVKAKKGIDIRKTGSGSTGATNVKRILGTKWFFTVMILDALKGIIAVTIAVKHYDLFEYTLRGLGPVLAALGVILGHSKSIFLKFTGGKSVATGVGTLIGLCWPVGLATAVIWGIITYTSKFVSLGSIVAITMAPILMRVFNQNEYYIWFTAICAAYVVIMHKDNIKRLCQGKENKVRK